MSKRRECVLEKLGGKCEACGTTKRLHLHHIYYSKGSARWVEGKHDPYNQREKEAYEHPERFKLFCVTCHGDFHSGGLDKIARRRKKASEKTMRVEIPLMEFEKRRLRKSGDRVFRNGKQIFP